MGERQGDGGPADRRVTHPGPLGPGMSGPGPNGIPPLDVLLATAVRARHVDPDGEARAVAAFLAARDQGAHTARTRRRDDWRPREQRRARRSVRATLAVLLAGLTLGGVAVAAVGGASDDPGDQDGRKTPSAGETDLPTPSESAAPTTSAPGAHSSAPGPERPSQAQDTEAQCRAYERVETRGRALDSAAWQRLVDAAGGVAEVEEYCAEQLDEERDAQPGDAAPGRTGEPGAPGGGAGSAAAHSEAASARPTTPTAGNPNGNAKRNQ
ncbi:hypothetical protein [Streptomyces sp. NPDC002845]